ncbi:hypothetical protein CVT26_012503 [Gymnopilus dilepis]|uniref:GATA-type domain-containing protein n=1 Tax=Gymnopilus dilepis TaxID=231916 RepID=A0A409YW35_9AGAR|nr:hypothetical protein CVT26_012503 [Gymnopilus dilepis]
MSSGYAQSANQLGGGGISNASGTWSTDARQSYQGMSAYGVDQRRWSAQSEADLRRRERRDVPHPSHAPDLSIPPDFAPSPFLGTTPSPNSPAFQPGHPRSSLELHAPAGSGWNSWNMPSGQPHSLGAHRYSHEQSWNNQLNVQIPQYSPNSVGDLIFSGSDSSSATLFTPADQAISLDGFTFPDRFSPVPSPSPSPVHNFVPSGSGTPPPAHQSRRRSEDRSSDSGKSCSHCHATSTPLWRRDPATMKTLCNGCGLYLQQRNKFRPQELIDADDDGSSSEESDENYDTSHIGLEKE